MAAHEQQQEAVVLARYCAGDRGVGSGVGLLPAAAGGLTAVGVDQTALGDAHQPAQRVVGGAFVGPLHRRRHQGLLHRVLGLAEPVAPGDHAEGLRRQRAQQDLGRGRLGHTSGSGALMISCTSMRWRMGAPPGPGAAETWAAISMARSMLSTSTMR